MVIIFYISVLKFCKPILKVNANNSSKLASPETFIHKSPTLFKIAEDIQNKKLNAPQPVAIISHEIRLSGTDQNIFRVHSRIEKHFIEERRQHFFLFNQIAAD